MTVLVNREAFSYAMSVDSCKLYLVQYQTQFGIIGAREITKPPRTKESLDNKNASIMWCRAVLIAIFWTSMKQEANANGRFKSDT